MNIPKGYSIESYEPTILRPEEVKQNNNYLKRPFLAREPVHNINNNRHINNILLNNKYSYNRYNITSPTKILFHQNINNNLTNNNSYNSYYSTIPKNTNQMNQLRIINLNPIKSNKAINYHKYNISPHHIHHFHQPYRQLKKNQSSIFPIYSQTRVLSNIPVYQKNIFIYK